MKLYHDKYWLLEKYYIEKLSQTDIANICGVARQTIQISMKKLNIQARDRIKGLTQKTCSSDFRKKIRENITKKRKLNESTPPPFISSLKKLNLPKQKSKILRHHDFFEEKIKQESE